MQKIAKNTNFNIPKSLLFFVLVSFLFWMLIKLSQIYESEQAFSLSYINLPKDKLLLNEPLKKVTLQLEASGYKLLTTQILNKKLIIDVKFIHQKTKETSYLLLSEQEKNIEKQFKSGIKIIGFTSDTIFFNFGYLASKKIPVIPNFKISYKSGYRLQNSITIKPDSVTITGPEKTLKNIKGLKTEFLELKNVQESITQQLKIIPIKKVKNVRLSQNTVFMDARVEQFTEGEIEIPVTIINVPSNIQINTFPKTVKVVYTVALSNFNRVKPNSFVVSCDYDYAVKNNMTYLIPELTQKSEFSSNEKITPNKIDFLISK